MKITMEHGSGGAATGKLIEEVFAKEFSNEILNQMEDSAVVYGNQKIAVTTDSFVVTPLEFPGGDIGRLAVCGTVNDLLMRGAIPKYLTCGFILQEGADTELLKRLVHSMAETAKEAGVVVVAGDTKVVEGNGGIFINTTGVGFIGEEMDISAAQAQHEDVVIVSGYLGEHHAAILSSRLEIANHIQSDNAPLTEMVQNLLKEKVRVHTMRDVTRGGLATVLKELAQASDARIEIEESKLPIHPQVKDFCGLLGLDPLYMGNEGKMVAFVAKEDAQKALDILRHSKYGEDAVIIGNVDKEVKQSERKSLILRTKLGGKRKLEVLQGEGLPRIC